MAEGTKRRWGKGRVCGCGKRVWDSGAHIIDARGQEHRCEHVKKAEKKS